jgi:DNA adenine methylase
MAITLFRYPGGKTKLARPILSRLNESPITEYREPFFGGGVIGLNVMNSGATNCWFNDKVPLLEALWNSVAFHTETLKRQIRTLQPSVEEYRRVRSEIEQYAHSEAPNDIVQIAVARLALQQMSFSGLGLMAGGPTGGIASHWSPESICKRIDAVAPALSRCRITCVDFAEMLQSDDHATIYLDPPYFHAGPRLYRHAFKLADHFRLRDLLRYSPHNWLLSYDDCPEIRELYAFARIDELPVRYSIQAQRRTVELLISPRSRNQTFLAMAA